MKGEKEFARLERKYWRGELQSIQLEEFTRISLREFARVSYASKHTLDTQLWKLDLLEKTLHAWVERICHLFLQLLLFICRLFEFPNGARPPCRTMPWTIPTALVVLWGVCWMFYGPEQESEYPSNWSGTEIEGEYELGRT